MPEYIADAKIKKVFKGKSGEHPDYGPWQAWNFYVEGEKDKRFSYFSGGSKPIPSEGRTVKLIEYEIERSGEYTNYNVKKLVYGSNPPQAGEPPLYDNPPVEAYENKPEQPQKPAQAPSRPDSTITMYVSYAKDLVCTMIPHGYLMEGTTAEDAADLIVKLGQRMYNMVNTGAPF